jgi:hypothetical protein
MAWLGIDLRPVRWFRGNLIAGGRGALSPAGAPSASPPGDRRRARWTIRRGPSACARRAIRCCRTSSNFPDTTGCPAAGIRDTARYEVVLPRCDGANRPS